MPANIVLISRFSTKPDMASALADALSIKEGGRAFVALEGDEVVVLEPVLSALTLQAMSNDLTSIALEYSTYLAGDVHRELLSFVEAPKSCSGDLPNTPYIQLRHVEVKPEEMSGYRKWRDETIFDVVRTSPEVETFLAYHSVVSGQPGVMFISGFSVDPKKYGAVFSSERYKSIVQQAGDQFITGGNEGLYTKLYRATEKLAA